MAKGFSFIELIIVIIIIGILGSFLYISFSGNILKVKDSDKELAVNSLRPHAIRGITEGKRGEDICNEVKSKIDSGQIFLGRNEFEITEPASSGSVSFSSIDEEDVVCQAKENYREFRIFAKFIEESVFFCTDSKGFLGKINQLKESYACESP